MPVKEPQAVEIASISEFATQFDEIIDVRSPAEYALDHLPGAINLPVLSNEQRRQVGTVNATESAFDANRLGAALISHNIGELLSGPLADRPRHWRPLVYCWRGGNRSASLGTVLARIGYRAGLLTGGYRSYRRWLVSDLPRRVAPLQLRIIAGRTGSGKGQILQALQRAGAQVLDLEGLANHRGSVLGLVPGSTQPSQKRFESLLWAALGAMQHSRPVFVEAESRKIGQLQVPECLITRMRASPCHVVRMSSSQRAAYLLRDYAHFVDDPAQLVSRLRRLVPSHGHEKVENWLRQIEAQDWVTFVEDILTTHYDPAYDRSMARNFANLDAAQQVSIGSTGEPVASEFELAAEEILTCVPSDERAVSHQPVPTTGAQ